MTYCIVHAKFGSHTTVTIVDHHGFDTKMRLFGAKMRSRQSQYLEWSALIISLKMIIKKAYFALGMGCKWLPSYSKTAVILLTLCSIFSSNTKANI